MPWPSVNRLRLTPPLARSVGFGPVFFPPERRLGHRPVHAQPVPRDALQLVKLFHPRLPEFQENVRFDPCLKPIVGRGFGTQLSLLQGCPLAARAEHIENGIGTAAIWYTWTPATKAMGIYPDREQRCEDGPEHIRDTEPSGCAVVRCASSCAFGWLS